MAVDVEGASRAAGATQEFPGIARGRSAAATVAEPLPKPLATAIRLLGWSGEAVPRIEVVSVKPPDTAANVEAWVRFANGQAIPVIYVRADTDVYRRAAAEDYQALIRLAGILAHERWHLRYGRAEVGAYAAQLAMMEYLHANSVHLAAVRMAFQRVTRAATKQEEQPRRAAPGLNHAEARDRAFVRAGRRSVSIWPSLGRRRIWNRHTCLALRHLGFSTGMLWRRESPPSGDRTRTAACHRGSG
jgi:hypothetical protein